ncbi:MAG TPA: RdgB/HAM1 family non-canonical purine NTP pyrophosphatase [Candidatus Kapabacteria bacterium]|nr:RdgB/HAM1 family non-canonical purine NTP pyrophosphatase [Candidatus Kapabacteria bacterium]HPO62221.1 RdgB/HAM1 family non-canonical purine NTP pyrophosphatase [Candidatus Kapabacteria bacterium]
MTLLLATNNEHKKREFLQIFDEYNIENIKLLMINDVLNNKIEIEETGKTFKENAFLKANALYQITKIPTIADDSGLEIDELGRLPGVDSAVFAGEPRSDKNNRKKVISLLEKSNLENFTARFRTIICYYNGKETFYFEGTCEGKIILEERGGNGFGYDSIFIPDGHENTFAEMSGEEKNKISHRANAIREFAKSETIYQVIPSTS